jgi:hypothetical protein
MHIALAVEPLSRSRVTSRGGAPGCWLGTEPPSAQATMPAGLKGALLGFGNPLLDISAGGCRRWPVPDLAPVSRSPHPSPVARPPQWCLRRCWTSTACSWATPSWRRTSTWHCTRHELSRGGPPLGHAGCGEADPLGGRVSQELVDKYPVEYIAGGATQNALRVAQWMLQCSGAASYVVRLRRPPRPPSHHHGPHTSVHAHRARWARTSSRACRRRWPARTGCAPTTSRWTAPPPASARCWWSTASAAWWRRWGRRSSTRRVCRVVLAALSLTLSVL